MQKILINLLLFPALVGGLFSCGGMPETHNVTILVVGGGVSGTAAGIQAARMGYSTLIVEETLWLGGMLTAAGVSATDGNYNLPGGI